MELYLQRTYHAKGANGTLLLDDHRLCSTIELPWRNNRKGRSCIPEGRYSLEARWSPHLKDHLVLENVPGRTLILIHPANNALSQLKGCIAPVSRLTGPGEGTGSEAAFEMIKMLVYPALRTERVWINVTSVS